MHWCLHYPQSNRRSCCVSAVAAYIYCSVNWSREEERVATLSPHLQIFFISTCVQLQDASKVFPQTQKRKSLQQRWLCNLMQTHTHIFIKAKLYWTHCDDVFLFHSYRLCDPSEKHIYQKAPLFGQLLTVTKTGILQVGDVVYKISRW